jgi:hypothetical protein
MPAVQMKEELDPRKKLLAIVGDLQIDYEVPDCHVLVATYRRPEKTRGGIVLPASNLDEDLYQSKECLALVVGHGATYNGAPIQPHDWLVIRPQEAWAMEMIFQKGALHCRIVYDKYIKGRVQAPGSIW